MPRERNTTKPKPVKKAAAKQTNLKTTEPTDLISFLSASLPDQKRKGILSLLKHRQVSVDRSVVTQYNHPLRTGQLITINWSKVIQKERYKGIKIVFEDPYLFVIDKPPGMLSIATDKEKERTALHILSDQVKRVDPRSFIFVVHRLDREVSGTTARRVE
jgi:23S rRNA pseudouridine1911/1915/1917 synthase